jgi:hypothetical protein
MVLDRFSRDQQIIAYLETGTYFRLPTLSAIHDASLRSASFSQLSFRRWSIVSGKASEF